MEGWMDLAKRLERENANLKDNISNLEKENKILMDFIKDLYASARLVDTYASKITHNRNSLDIAKIDLSMTLNRISKWIENNKGSEE